MQDISDKIVARQLGFVFQLARSGNEDAFMDIISARNEAVAGFRQAVQQSRYPLLLVFNGLSGAGKDAAIACCLRIIRSAVRVAKDLSREWREGEADRDTPGVPAELIQQLGRSDDYLAYPAGLEQWCGVPLARVWRATSENRLTCLVLRSEPLIQELVQASGPGIHVLPVLIHAPQAIRRLRVNATDAVRLARDEQQPPPDPNNPIYCGVIQNDAGLLANLEVRFLNLIASQLHPPPLRSTTQP